MLKRGFLLILIICNCEFSAQNLQQVLGAAYLAKTQDSSDYYFNKAKKLVKTDGEEGEYFFCKNARHLDYGNQDSSAYYGKLAIQKLKNLPNKNSLFTTYYNLGKLYKKRGEYDKGIAITIEAIKIAEANNEKGWIATFDNMLSLTYHDFENYPKGVYYGKKALAYHLTQEKPNQKKIYSNLNAVAINYDDWGNAKEALRYHHMVFKYIKGKDTLGINSTYNNIGNTLLKIKKFHEAEKWIKRAVKITDYNLKNNGDDNYYDYDQATHYTNLATIAYELSDFDKAEKMFLLAKKHAQKSKNAEKMRDYLFQVSIFNKKRKDLTKIVASQEEYIKLRDSVFNSERIQSVAEMEAKYQTEKKEKELLLAKNTLIQKEAETKKKNLWLLIASLIAGFIALIGYLFVRQQKARNSQQKQEFELRTAIAKIESQNELQEQRLSISRDLHDNIGSQLTFVISSIENLKFGIGNSNQKAETKLSQISNFTKSTITELRDTIWAMNTNEIVFDDLRVRILNFLDNARIAQETIDFDFNIDEGLKEVKLTSLVWVNIYRTTQEAVNNAIKYSDATKISIRVNEIGNQIQIQIQDNGKGFNMAEVNKGNGLFNMEKRITEIGGKFEIKSIANNGTSVKILI
ncbi:tetratricopeptide repeat-containing sensor histidine kinase [Flavobacterium amnicola]|nr:tetratricopeptide repeat-containing sensor histidine kinase [Flavobacterium amnicola]